ncbi:hypothetical protein M514_06858 [Trichuris suis]|uniref:Uncharacterized protein n=1 Tax=Trichuris suis TaxID=68888 RepID=A0A085NBA6_9BILA|nr:hypothetical protein M514_06858 [Trichuris suis]
MVMQFTVKHAFENFHRFFPATRLPRRLFCQSSDEAPFNLMEQRLSYVSLNPLRRLMLFFVILRYRAAYDKTFKLDEFEQGALQAFYVLSAALFGRDYDRIEKITTAETGKALRTSLQRVPDGKLWVFDLKESDVYFRQLHSGAIVSAAGSTVLQMLMVYHAFYKRQEFQESTEEMSTDKILQVRHRFVVANLRLIKQLTPSYDEDWLIDYANYGQIHPGDP